MNMQQILNDPELSKELDKAYALAAPYREKVQYKLHLINKSLIYDRYIYLPLTGLLISIHPTNDKFNLIHPMLKV